MNRCERAFRSENRLTTEATWNGNFVCNFRCAPSCTNCTWMYERNIFWIYITVSLYDWSKQRASCCTTLYHYFTLFLPSPPPSDSRPFYPNSRLLYGLYEAGKRNDVFGARNYGKHFTARTVISVRRRWVNSSLEQIRIYTYCAVVDVYIDINM